MRQFVGSKRLINDLQQVLFQADPNVLKRGAWNRRNTSSLKFVCFWCHSPQVGRGLLIIYTLDAGLLARSQYSEGPATGHLDTGFS